MVLIALVPRVSWKSLKILLVLTNAKLNSNPCDSLYSENISVTKICPIGAIFWSIKLRQSTLLSKKFHCPLLWVFGLVSLCESCPVFFFSSSAPHFPKGLSLLHKQASHPPRQIPMTTCMHYLTPLPFHLLCGCSIFELCLSKSPPCFFPHI